MSKVSEYKSYYLGDLRAMINSVAIETMIQPMLPADPFDPPASQKATTRMNDRLALFNGGIRAMAKELIGRLEGDENTDDA